MQGAQLDCVKVKDGLYIGSYFIAQDFEFVVMNKFAYVVNCAAQLPNVFENEGICYLKFKLVRDKRHKLWQKGFEKVDRILDFVGQCEAQGLCCLIVSCGDLRSVVMLCVYLMAHFGWTLAKTREFLRSKRLPDALNEHFREQLLILQTHLTTLKPLSESWQPPYASLEEELLVRTLMNSQTTIKETSPPKEKKARRITWDLPEPPKERAKLANSKHNTKKQGRQVGKKDRDLRDDSRCPEDDSKSVEESKETRSGRDFGVGGQNQLDIRADSKASLSGFELTDDGLIQLIKSNLKMKRGRESVGNKALSEEPSESNGNPHEVYKLTINNFIQPSIKIQVGEKSKPQKRPQSSKVPIRSDLDDRVNRTYSEKQYLPPKPPPIGEKAAKAQKPSDPSPGRRERPREAKSSTSLKRSKF